MNKSITILFVAMLIVVFIRSVIGNMDSLQFPLTTVTEILFDIPNATEQYIKQATQSAYKLSYGEIPCDCGILNPVYKYII
jgi:hypothetical protein